MNGNSNILNVRAEDLGLPTVVAGDNTFNLIVGLIYTVIAALALFYIVRAGLLFITSGSDPNSVKEARETILYSIVALIGSTVVFAAIQFVARSVSS